MELLAFASALPGIIGGIIAGLGIIGLAIIVAAILCGLWFFGII